MKIQFNPKNCSGCGVCKLSCSIVNFRQVTASKALLRIEGLFPEPGRYIIHFCDQCGQCAEVCPTEAIAADEQGIFRVNEADCIACHACFEACPRSVMIIKKEDDFPAKCIACYECARTCPRQAIPLSDEIVKEAR